MKTVKYNLLIGSRVKIDNDHFGEIVELRELHARVKYIGEGGERTSLIEYERLSVNYPNKEIKNTDIVSERDYWRLHYNKTQDYLDKATKNNSILVEQLAASNSFLDKRCSENNELSVTIHKLEEQLAAKDKELSEAIDENIIEFIKGCFQCYVGGISGNLEKYINESNYKITRK